jgi:hypothetical protein
MDSYKKTGIVVGALFIVATAVSMLGSVVLGSVLEGSGYLIDVAASESQVILAVLLLLVAASSAFATAFLLFPILRGHSEGLAAGYVGTQRFRERVLRRGHSRSSDHADREPEQRGRFSGSFPPGCRSTGIA